MGHLVCWLVLAAVAAPLLAEIPLGFRVPVVVLEFGKMKGRPLALAGIGWGVPILLGFLAVGILRVIPQVDALLIVTQGGKHTRFPSIARPELSP